MACIALESGRKPLLVKSAAALPGSSSSLGGDWHSESERIAVAQFPFDHAWRGVDLSLLLTMTAAEADRDARRRTFQGQRPPRCRPGKNTQAGRGQSGQETQANHRLGSSNSATVYASDKAERCLQQLLEEGFG